jgi:hypothetical protein
MYHTTGLDKAEILGLCEIIHQEVIASERTRPILGLYKSVVVTLTYLRRNRVQAEIRRVVRRIAVNDQPSDCRHDGPDRAGAAQVRAHCGRAR